MRQVAGRAALTALAAIVALVVLALLALGTGSALAARVDNGIAGKSPDQILATSLAAGEHAHSVHIVGHIVSGGSHIGMDLRFSGTHAAGRLTEDGAAFDLVLLGKRAFIRGGAAFWQREGVKPGDPTIALFANRWVGGSTAAGKPFHGFGSEFRLRGLLTSVGSSHARLELAGTTKIHGRPAVALRDTKQGGTISIATTGTPYPLSIQKTKGSDTGTLFFDDWNEPVTIAAPRTYVDLDRLTSTGKP
jgi:hypothetical protein